MPNLVSKAAFAQMADVSAPAITKACKAQLAIVLVGKKIDADHPEAKAYIRRNKGKRKARSAQSRELRKRGRPAAKPKPQRKTTAKKQPNVDTSDAEDFLNEDPNADIAEFLDLTLRQVVVRYGTEQRFSEWLRSVKILEDIKKAQIANAEKEGGLVSRSLVQHSVISPIITAHNRLLNDTPPTIARQVALMVKADEPVEACEKWIREQFSSHIQPMKDRIMKALKDGSS